MPLKYHTNITCQWFYLLPTSPTRTVLNLADFAGLNPTQRSKKTEQVFTPTRFSFVQLLTNSLVTS